MREDQFLRRRGKTERVGIEALNALVGKIIASPIRRTTRMVAGKSNEVYAVTVESGEEFIVRISRDLDYSRLQEEQWALQQCAGIGVPVPAILLIDTVHVGAAHFNACVETYVPGEPLSDLPLVSDEEKKAVLAQAGGILAKIHSIPIEGFGLFDEHGKGRYSSIQEVFADPYIAKEKMLAIAREVGCDEAVLLKAFEIMEKEAASYPAIAPRLVHNDFEPKHILVSGDQVTGIIDFEMAEGGDPILDFARWHFKHKDIHEVEDLMAGYTNREIFAGTWKTHFNLWRIYVGIGKLAHTYQEKDKEGIAFAIREITSDVNYWNSDLRNHQ